MTVLKAIIRIQSYCFIILLTGCSIMSPVKTDNFTTYVIDSAPNVYKRSSGHGVLLVSQVKADPLYETSAMAYTSHSYQVEYFAKTRWSETPAKMLQPLILKTLQNSHYFHAVTASSSSIRYDYILKVRLIELRQIFMTHSSSVVVSMHAEMIHAKSGVILYAKDITTEVPALCMNPFSGVVAANQAVAISLKKLARFSFKAVSGNRSTSH